MASDAGIIIEQLPLFEDKRVLLNRGILELTRLNLKEETPALKAKLFFRGIILCDNEPLLRFVKRISFIEVRRLMKDLNPALFSRYLKLIEGGDQY